MSSTYVSYRYIPEGFIYDSNKGPMIFPKAEENLSMLYSIGFLNTKISNTITSILNPTVSTQIGDLIKVPILIIDNDKRLTIEDFANECIDISVNDWDAHETSWDFKTNELISLRNQSFKGGESEKEFKLSSLVDEYKKRWEDNFMQLHANEEELNRQFIEIYGLQDELTPDVPLEEITILQQGEISIEREQTSSPLE